MRRSLAPPARRRPRVGVPGARARPRLAAGSAALRARLAAQARRRAQRSSRACVRVRPTPARPAAPSTTRGSPPPTVVGRGGATDREALRRPWGVRSLGARPPSCECARRRRRRASSPSRLTDYSTDTSCCSQDCCSPRRPPRSLRPPRHLTPSSTCRRWVSRARGASSSYCSAAIAAWRAPQRRGVAGMTPGGACCRRAQCACQHVGCAGRRHGDVHGGRVSASGGGYALGSSGARSWRDTGAANRLPCGPHSFARALHP
jgi:hypothetical protein